MYVWCAEDEAEQDWRDSLSHSNSWPGQGQQETRAEPELSLAVSMRLTDDDATGRLLSHQGLSPSRRQRDNGHMHSLSALR